jgi:hypothetical protein
MGEDEVRQGLRLEFIVCHCEGGSADCGNPFEISAGLLRRCASRNDKDLIGPNS